MLKKLLICSASVLFCMSHAITISGCSSNTDTSIKIVQETYYPVRRQTPPEPVYSRVTWSHLPKPIGSVSNNKTVFLHKTTSYEFKKSTLAEAVDAVAQSIGFEAVYPKNIAKRPVTMKLEGSPDDALAKLCEQTNTSIEVDQSARKLTIVDKALVPTLPANIEPMRTSSVQNNAAKSDTIKGETAEGKGIQEYDIQEPH